MKKIDEKTIFHILITIGFVWLLFVICALPIIRQHKDPLDIQERQARALENIANQLSIIAKNSEKR